VFGMMLEAQEDRMSAEGEPLTDCPTLDDALDRALQVQSVFIAALTAGRYGKEASRLAVGLGKSDDGNSYTLEVNAPTAEVARDLPKRFCDIDIHLNVTGRSRATSSAR